jgi:hypothetical protein
MRQTGNPFGTQMMMGQPDQRTMKNTMMMNPFQTKNINEVFDYSQNQTQLSAQQPPRHPDFSNMTSSPATNQNITKVLRQQDMQVTSFNSSNPLQQVNTPTNYG